MKQLAGNGSIQYVRLADGSLKAMMSLGNTDQPQRISMIDQQPPAASQAPGSAQSTMLVSQGYTIGQPQMQYNDTASLLAGGPGSMPNNLTPGAPPQMTGPEHSLSTPHMHYINHASTVANQPEGHVRSTTMTHSQIESMQVIEAGTNLPANASQTLYVDDVPLDMQKRELCHIFRPFGGFKVRPIYSRCTAWTLIGCVFHGAPWDWL